MSDGGNRRVGLATRSGVRPRAAMRAVHGVLDPMSVGAASLARFPA